jgi:predicted nucleic acid-binding protein
LYLDSSAITKLIIDEPESDALVRVVRGRTLVSSIIALVEVPKAVARHDASADPDPMLRRLWLLGIDRELARAASVTGGPLLRAPDAIHIAAALLVADDIDGFVTYDARQSAAAAAVGLQVVSPGS